MLYTESTTDKFGLNSWNISLTFSKIFINIILRIRGTACALIALFWGKRTNVREKSTAKVWNLASYYEWMSYLVYYTVQYRPRPVYTVPSACGPRLLTLQYNKGIAIRQGTRTGALHMFCTASRVREGDRIPVPPCTMLHINIVKCFTVHVLVTLNF